MRRDLELIKLLLQEAEEEQPKPDLSGYTEEAILYHLVLMEDADLIVAKFVFASSGRAVAANVRRLTNMGHDFLDAARNDTIWAQFKERVKRVGGSLSISLAVEVLKGLVRENLDR